MLVKKHLLLIIGSTLVLISNQISHAGTWRSYYVSTTGSDNNKGTRASPFATLEKARDEVSTIKDSATDTIRVFLQEGTYRLTKPFALGPEFSGSTVAPVVYCGVTQGKTVLDGGTVISGWTVHDSAKNIYKTLVPTNVLFRQLYTNGFPQIRARNPDRDEKAGFGPYYKNTGENGKTRFIVQTSDIPVVSSWEGIEFVLNPVWYHLVLRIQSAVASGATTTLSFKSPEQEYYYNKETDFYTNDAYYYLENAIEFVNSPGEWYLDQTRGTIYYCIPSSTDINDLVITRPVVEHCVTITGTADNPVRNICFENIEFSTTMWNKPSFRGATLTQGAQDIDPDAPSLGTGVVQFDYADNITIRNSVIRNAGANGIVLGRGVVNCTISGNQVFDIMANGIVIDNIKKITRLASDECKNILISNNYIRDIGTRYSNGMGIISSFASNLTIEHNEIYNVPYMGMQIGNQTNGVDAKFGNNKLRYNEVSFAMQCHVDGGGIYTLGLQPGTLIYQNYVHDMSRSPWIRTNYPFVGLYCDNFSSSIVWQDNVVKNVETVSTQQTNATNIQWISNTTGNVAVESAAGLLDAYKYLKDSVDRKFNILYTSSSLKTEAENMALYYYTIESNPAFSNGKGIKAPVGKNVKAQYLYTGKGGVYNVVVGYGAENDGNPPYTLYVNSNKIGQWTASTAAGSLETATQTFSFISINKNDIITIESKQTASSHARLDYVELKPIPTSFTSSALKTEAENMALDLYTIEENALYSNNKGLKAPVGATAKAQFVYTGEDGDFSVNIGYGAEYDGNAPYTLYLNSNKVATWTAVNSIANTAFEIAVQLFNLLTIRKNDIITIEGTQTAASHARLDYIELTPIPTNAYNPKPTGPKVSINQIGNKVLRVQSNVNCLVMVYDLAGRVIYSGKIKKSISNIRLNVAGLKVVRITDARDNSLIMGRSFIVN